MPVNTKDLSCRPLQPIQSPGSLTLSRASCLSDAVGLGLSNSAVFFYRGSTLAVNHLNLSLYGCTGQADLIVLPCPLVSGDAASRICARVVPMLPSWLWMSSRKFSFVRAANESLEFG